MSGESLINFTACVSALWAVAVLSGLLWMTFGEMTWPQRYQLTKRLVSRLVHVLAELFLIGVMLVVAAAVVTSWASVLLRYLR